MTSARWSFFALLLGLGLLASPALASQCNDGIDNDNDGTIDGTDVGCATTEINKALSSDNDERVGLGFDPGTNSSKGCTGNRNPWACCTGNQTGTCTSSRSSNACPVACENAMKETCPGGSCTGSIAAGGTCAGGANAGNRCLFVVGGVDSTSLNISSTYDNATLQYLALLGYGHFGADNTNTSCVKIANGQMKIEGTGNTFSCFDAGMSDGTTSGHSLYVIGTGNVFQDGLIHDTYTASNQDLNYNAIISISGTDTKIRRVELVRHTGLNLFPGKNNQPPGTGSVIEVSGGYSYDMSVRGATHVEHWATEGTSGGTLNFFHNRAVFSPDIDPPGDGGWTAGTKFQRTNASPGTPLINLYQNLFTAASPLVNVFYTFNFHSQASSGCTGPSNVYQNQLITGTSGFMQSTGPSDCNICTVGGTAYGNVNLTGGAVTFPGGNCGQSVPSVPEAPVLLP